MPTGMEPKAAASENINLSNLVPKEHKLYHIFHFIGENYNNPENILRALGSILDFDKGLRALFTGKFSFKKVVNLLRYTLPGSLYGVEMGLKLSKYIKQVRKGDLSEYEKRLIEIRKLLDLSHNKGINDWHISYINEDIVEWLLRSPKTKGYKILGYYNSSTLEKLEKVPNDFEDIFVLFEFQEKRFLIQVTVKSFGGMKFIDHMNFLAEFPGTSSDHLRELELLILKDFILTFDIKENILEFKGGITTKGRAVVNEKINQYDVKPLIAGIRKVLKNGRKRGHAFIGKQGTGKSIIMRKLEELLTDLIIIRITPEEFATNSGIKRCFNLIKTVQPALVIIEDLDAFRFKEKNERVGTFINEIDSEDLNIVIIVTINDPDMIHRTIIDRPGRFDEIHEIKPPQTELEAYEVMKSKYNKLLDFYTDFKGIQFPNMKKLNHGLIQRCVNNKFTQAELTNGIIEKIFINIDNPEELCFNDAIKEAVTSFEISKKSLRTYKFYEKEPDPDEDEVKACDDTDEESAPQPALTEDTG
jgi:hypothetical protein